MASSTVYKKYQSKCDYSYTLGAFPTIELLKNKPDKVIKILIHPDMDSEEQLDILNELCNKNKIELCKSKAEVERLRDKENIYCIGIFNKYDEKLKDSKGHVVLVNPGDMGNLGTIIRTAIGFGIDDLAIIEPAADIFNPKAVRASMGALFQLRFRRYASFDEYESENKGREFFPFMLKGATDLQMLDKSHVDKYALIFGNEATGLPDEFANKGTSVLIRHEKTIDSLNLSMACGIALYEFTK
ncbi:MAG: TrmH family RNA methyltransferase [Lachnospiraceae bacterium]|nr:TrmH family RNA methyltransferase [Lachnospiraceae bacterium]